MPRSTKNKTKMPDTLRSGSAEPDSTGETMDREYRVMWRGRGSDLRLQLGAVYQTHAEASMMTRHRTANELRAEGCIVWIESRTVGPWEHKPNLSHLNDQCDGW